MTDQNRNDLKVICNFYGCKAQEIKAIEEMSELTKVLCKKSILGSSLFREHFTEEVSDVIICIENLKYLFNISDKDLQKMIDFKIKRTLERIQQ